ncbi:hypothetical protein [Marinifilum flexuosum]|uniref:Uncharacterized protein n=1 Tax=Marinifilum flexuosum TaxID=1117708 RepID=A0A419WMQ6_9BACT|nr:hypothetical protein [Marinifilum flexuosum]RKD96749.1 hypothetical protein BXY64_3695 [Marinifilum flexuosum]
MEEKTNETVEINEQPIKSKVELMEDRWRELYREGKRGEAILKVLCAEFFYKHPVSIYRVLDVSKLRLEMREQ